MLRPNLVIGRHVCGIAGMEREESERLLERLANAASQPRRVGAKSGHPGRTFWLQSYDDSPQVSQ